MKLHEKRTAEYRISNRKMSKCGIALGLRSLFGGVGSLSLFLNRQNPFLRHSEFLVRYSLFAFSFGQSAAISLNPEP